MIRPGKFLVAIAATALMLQAWGVAEQDGQVFTFSIRGDARYTDNRDSVPDDLKESNTDFFIRPQFDIFHQGERSTLDFYYAPAYRYRTDPATTQNDDQWEHYLRLAWRHNTTERMEFRLNNFFDYTQDSSIEDGVRTIRADEGYMLNRFATGINLISGRRSILDLEGKYEVKLYDESEVAAESDQSRSDGIFTYFFQTTETVALRGVARYANFDFESDRGLVRDFNSAVLAAGVDKAFSPNMRGSLTVGYQGARYKDDAIGDSDNPYVDARISGYTVPSTRLGFSVRHALRDADVYPYSSQQFTDLKADVEWDTTVRLMFVLRGLYRMSEYTADTLPGEVQDSAPEERLVDGDETVITGTAEVVYKFDRGLTLMLSQRYEDVDSDVSVSFTKNTTMLSIAKAF